jgi:light-regulated signal transduction histidine kinase (bacteriophytochrome)
MVTNYLQLLEQRYAAQLDPKAREFVAYAVDGAARMQQLIRDLLTYSRVSTKVQPFEETNTAEALERAVSNLKLAIEESGGAVTHGTLPVVLGDPLLLSQLFQNLISNALKFRGPQPPLVRIEAERRDNEWLFSVRDNGIGVDPRDFNRIFVIFQRLHSREKYAGTGIGLSVCKKIIERHGGRIWLESQPGQGTTFYFTLPVGARS